MRTLRDGSLRVEQDILVPTLGVRKIVVGRHGAAIGHVGTKARHTLQRLLGRAVHLILNCRLDRHASEAA